MEDDWTGEEEPLRRHLAALSCRLRHVLRPLRPAARHRARRTRRGARSDLRASSKRSRLRRSRMNRLRRRQRQRCERVGSAGADAAVAMPADLASRSALFALAGNRSSPPAASIASRRRRSIGATPTRAGASSRAGRRRSPAPISIPEANRKRMEAIVKRMEDLAASLAGPADEADVAAAEARDDAEGSARGEHDRRQSRSREPAAAPRRTTCARRRRAGRASGRCPTTRGRRSPIGSSAPSGRSQVTEARVATAPSIQPRQPPGHRRCRLRPAASDPVRISSSARSSHSRAGSVTRARRIEASVCLRRRPGSGRRPPADCRMPRGPARHRSGQNARTRPSKKLI